MILRISFSGGRTSGRMTKELLDAHKNGTLLDPFGKRYEKVIVTFANTGCEHFLTLLFIHNCDAHFGFNTVWLEAEVNPKKGVGNDFRVVTYETASRKGEPFEAYIAKHGIPNMAFPKCTSELKASVMNAYRRALGLKKKDCVTAIGIRVDESRRVNKAAVKENIIYPLIDMFPMDKQDVIDWWKDQPFDLEIPEHLGNCTWCWKKSFSKHLHVMQDMPEAFDFPERMEMKYPLVGPEKPIVPRRFFRKYMSVSDIRNHHSMLAGNLPKIAKQEDYGGCSESCELFPMEEK